jgi:4-hydroxyproline epimerase
VRFQNLERLTDCTMKIRRALSRGKITGADSQEIDHIELFGPPTVPGANSKNFVLCPGGVYDRSPCGTGTSAKLACLYADGKLTEGQTWRQESIIGSIFDGAVKVRDNSVYPLIKSTAYVTADSLLILDSRDPFNEGIRA